jgi:hypothetical protein
MEIVKREFFGQLEKLGRGRLFRDWLGFKLQLARETG